MTLVSDANEMENLLTHILSDDNYGEIPAYADAVDIAGQRIVKRACVRDVSVFRLIGT
jgi:hypothetical protein